MWGLRRVFAGIVGVGMMTAASFAQSIEPYAAEGAGEDSTQVNAEAYVLGAHRIAAAQRPSVDGRLDEAVWAEAPVATGFVQFEPDAGQPASEHTEARVLYDGAALYVGFRNWPAATSPSSATGLRSASTATMTSGRRSSSP